MVWRTLAGSGLRACASFLFAQHEQVQAFDLVARPGCAPQKFQTRADTGLVREASNRNQRAQLLPAVMVSQLRDDHLQRQAVQWVAGLCGLLGHVHGLMVFVMGESLGALCALHQRPVMCLLQHGLRCVATYFSFDFALMLMTGAYETVCPCASDVP